MATLSVGGNDIDFKGILFNCILETTEFGGTPTKTCDQQITDTWALLNSPDLVANLDALIKLTVTRGTIGDSFLLYVTGFPEFFNDVDLGCNSVTFARTANPVPDGKDHGMMTTDRRGTFNQMSVALNAAIQHAVFLNEDTGVKFIDIQANNILDGHRFCEPGIVEPDQNNPNLWLWHYPYKQNDDSNAPANLQILLNATAQITQGLTIAQLGVEFPTAAAFDDAMWNAVDSSEVATANSGDPTAAGFWDGFIGWRAKLFHPQVPYHAVIKNMIINQYLADTNVFTS